MLEFIFGKLLAAPVIGAIFKPIVDGLLTAQKQKLDAAGSHEARETEIAIKAMEVDRREAEVNAEVVKAEQGNRFTRSIRPLIALAVVILVWKILVFDKALGQWTSGHTDGLDDKLWNVVMVIIISYFGGRSAEKVATTVAGVFKRK